MKPKKTAFKMWLGGGIIVFATLFIPMLAFVPMLHITVKQKALLSGILIIGGQVLTWIGIALVGKEIYQNYRKKIFSYLKKFFSRLLTKK